jgi:hypothetical protein
MALFPLGILSAAGAGGVQGDFELITSTILGTATSSITFDVSSFASTYKHLQIRSTARSAGAGSEFLRIKLNGSNITIRHFLIGNGSSVTSGVGADIDFMGIPNSGSASGLFSPAVFDFLDPYSSTKNKTIRALAGSPLTGIGLLSGLVNSTTITSSLTVETYFGANFATGSRFSIYGIRG